jgi:protein gp37
LNRSKIEWTDYTWNPITGCSRRCKYCYAWRMAKRLRGKYGYPEDDPFRVTFHPERLKEPRQVKKPSKIFICSMGEMFDIDSKYGWIELILAEIKRSSQHTFQILTKRPDVLYQFDFPFNVWLGISIDTQEAARERLPYLLDNDVDATVKFASFEPLLEKVDVNLEGLDWIIIGAQTQPWRPPAYEWVAALLKQARRYGIPYFLKDNLKPRFNVSPLEQMFPATAHSKEI